MNKPPATTDELRAAWARARVLRFSGWTFERAMATPMVRQSLETSAIAHRLTGFPQQPSLI